MSDSQPVGNVYDKYHTRNPIHAWVVARFLRSVCTSLKTLAPRRVLEVGCGEGYLAHRLIQALPDCDRFVASDLDLCRVATGLDDRVVFQQASAYDLPYGDKEFETVVCCEVLEHLQDPARAVEEIARVTERTAILSVPWEPWWRICNSLQGRYLTQLGNTPGHLQHFSRRSFTTLLRKHFPTVACRPVFPWLIAVATKTKSTT